MADYQGTCPLGGLWYTCTAQSPTFFGCCTSDPCNGMGCPSGDLRPAGLGIGPGPDLPANDSSFYPNVHCAQGQWWTCAAQTPSFQGCCNCNPCGGAGCPLGELSPAASSTPLTAVATPAPACTSAPISSQSPSSSGTVSQASGSSPQTTIIASSTANIPAIAGAAAGGVALLIVLGFAFYLCRRRRICSHDLGEMGTVLEMSPIMTDGHNKAARNKHLSMNSAVTGGAPESPPPAYRGSHFLGIDEVYELDTNGITGIQGLAIEQVVTQQPAQEVDAGRDTPNPYPVQREWIASGRSELPTSPMVGRRAADSPRFRGSESEDAIRDVIGGDERRSPTDLPDWRG